MTEKFIGLLNQSITDQLATTNQLTGHLKQIQAVQTVEVVSTYLTNKHFQCRMSIDWILLKMVHLLPASCTAYNSMQSFLYREDYKPHINSFLFLFFKKSVYTYFIFLQDSGLSGVSYAFIYHPALEKSFCNHSPFKDWNNFPLISVLHLRPRIQFSSFERFNLD